MDRRIYDARFRRGPAVTIEFDGETYRGYEGEPLAVALHAGGVRVLGRSIKYHRPRSFFCLAGHCGACLMRVSSVPNLRSCQVPCEDGMVAEGQNAFPASDIDILGAVDFLFPRGMDHHTLMTRSRLMNTVMQRAVRKLSGLGTLPAAPAGEFPAVVEQTVDVAVIGGGPAGLEVATATAAAGAKTLCVDDQDRMGGSLDPDAAAKAAAAAAAAGAELVPGTTVIAYFPEESVLAAVTPAGLRRVRARRYVYATGAHDVNAPFAGNDRPGVFAARAVHRLLVRHGVIPGARVAIVGDAPAAAPLADALAGAGVAVETATQATRARGTKWVEAIDADGRRIACDTVAVAATPAPASEAARSHGAAVELRPATGGFAVVIDAMGRTSASGVYAAGDVTGYRGSAAARAHGAEVGANVVKSL